MKDKNKKDKLKDDVIDLGPMLRSLPDSVPPKPKEIIDLGPYLERYKKQEKALLSDNSRQEQIPPPVAVREPIDETPPAVGSKSVISNQEQPPHTDEIQPNAEIEEPKETVVFDNGREVEEPEIPTVEIPEENVLPPESAGDTAVGDPDNQNLAQLTDDHERLRVASNQAPAGTGTETDLQATPQSAVGQPELPEQSELFEQPETPVTGVDKKAAQADVAKELSAAQEAVISAAETPEVPKAVAKGMRKSFGQLKRRCRKRQLLTVQNGPAKEGRYWRFWNQAIQNNFPKFRKLVGTQKAINRLLKKVIRIKLMPLKLRSWKIGEWEVTINDG